MVFLRVFERVFSLQVAIAATVFVIVTLLLLVAVWRNRAGRRPDLPFRRSQNTPLEALYAVGLAGVAGFLVWLSLSANDSVTAPAGPAGGDAVGAAKTTPLARVTVTAFQWCWSFDYQGTPVHVTGTCVDRAHAPTLIVPVGQPVRLELTSKDVIHSLWIPELVVKKDAMPDHVNTLTLTFDREGRWLGRCSEYCGSHHATMDFFVQAVPPDQYQQWLAHGGGATI
ncbi:MAG: cytochrome c oxidase subunit II [Pseudonocardia sp.]|nr:cytochrome c oxidase subunit II [Pseudonocardia sp.]